MKTTSVGSSVRAIALKGDKILGLDRMEERPIQVRFVRLAHIKAQLLLILGVLVRLLVLLHILKSLKQKLDRAALGMLDPVTSARGLRIEDRRVLRLRDRRVVRFLSARALRRAFRSHWERGCVRAT